METIVLLFGGNSVEHEISILTFKQVYQAINKDKYNVLSIYVSKDNMFYLIKDLNFKNLNDLQKHPLKLFKEGNKQYFKTKFKKYYFDLVFILMHGKGVEDGTINGYFDFLDIPYVANNLLASAVGMDKYLSKIIAKQNKINVLDGKIININDIDLDDFINSLNDFPYIFKANSLGSSIGVYKVNNIDDAYEALNNIGTYEDYVLIEKCLDDFKEYNLSLFKSKDELIISSIEEINYKNILSYNDKYANKGLENLKRVISPNIDNKLKNKIINYSKKLYSLLKCDSVVRIDYLYDNNNSELYFNEINMIPGSLSFYLYEDKNILFDKLIDLLIEKAKRNRYLKISKVNILGDNILEGLVKNIKK